VTILLLPLYELPFCLLRETKLDDSQGIFQFSDLEAFWGHLCGLAKQCSVVSLAWGAFEASRKKHGSGNPWGLESRELSGYSKDRVLGVGHDRFKANGGYKKVCVCQTKGRCG
jgi:hypothetical protein